MSAKRNGEAGTSPNPVILIRYVENPEFTTPALLRQARWLACKFGLPIERAKLLAGLAFETTGRRA
jgi:hypothetical protein